MVFMHHSCTEFLTSADSNIFFYLYRSIGKIGNMGVHVFFIISGFLITGVLIKGYSKNLDVPRFYIHRFLKIVPVFIFVFIFLSILMKMAHLYPDQNIRRYGNTLLYLFNDRYTFAFLHLWTLRVESLYYIFYPLIVCAVFFHLKRPKVRRLMLVILAFLVMVISIVIRHVDIIEGSPVLVSLDGLSLGCILKFMEPYYSRIRYPKHFWLGGCILGIILTFYSLFLWEWDKKLGVSLFVVLFFFLCYFNVKFINLFLENQLIRSLGKISYVVYLIHLPLTHIVSDRMTYWGSNHLRLLWLAMITVFLGAVITNTVEKYFLGLKRYIK